jgi:hypothetical protein
VNKTHNVFTTLYFPCDLQISQISKSVWPWQAFLWGIYGTDFSVRALGPDKHFNFCGKAKYLSNGAQLIENLSVLLVNLGKKKRFRGKKVL